MSDIAFSLDLNDKYTRIVDVKSSSKKVELGAVGFEETVPFFYSSDNPKVIQDQAAIITKMLTNMKIKKRNVHIIIPDTYTFSQILEMPKLKEKELLAAIRYQADEFIPMPIDETSIDLEILKEDTVNRKLLILIVASPKKIVEQIEKVMEAAHLTPESLENELSVAGRMVSEISPLKSQSYVLVNFGYYTTSLYLVDGASNLIVTARTFKVGLELFFKDVKVNMNWDDKKVFEVLRTIGFASNGSVNLATLFGPFMNEYVSEIRKFMVLAKDHFNANPTKIYMYNYGAYINMFDKVLAQMVGTPVEAFPIQNSIVSSPANSSLAPELPALVSAIGGNIR